MRNAITRAVQHMMTNAVTELPEGALVEDRLKAVIKSETEWAALVLSVSQWQAFRELYGFVAADDVLRAVALMIRNAVRELGSEDDFVGHLAPEDFVVLTSAGVAGPIRERLESRMEQSSAYFYPMRDHEETQEGVETERLGLDCAVVESAAGPFETVEALFGALDYTPRA